MRKAAGILLAGGGDVDPAIYRERAHPSFDAAEPGRDAYEIDLIRLADEADVPMLAICRGIQVVNVALGGTLVQDIATECATTLKHDQSEARTQRVHEVDVVEDSVLASAVGTTRLSVNSSHHQAVASLADGLAVTARAPDGIVEGAEWRGDDWWMLAVQWHPEELTRDPSPWDRGLFTAFADRVRR